LGESRLERFTGHFKRWLHTPPKSATFCPFSSCCRVSRTFESRILRTSKPDSAGGSNGVSKQPLLLLVLPVQVPNLCVARPWSGGGYLCHSSALVSMGRVRVANSCVVMGPLLVVRPLLVDPSKVVVPELVGVLLLEAGICGGELKVWGGAGAAVRLQHFFLCSLQFFFGGGDEG